MIKVHVHDTDPRKLTDKDFLSNCGSFSVVANNFNKGLQLLGNYDEPDNCSHVGIADGLNLNFRYKDKKPFIISVWDATEIPVEILRFFEQKPSLKLLGLSEQVTQLYNRYGIPCQTTSCGIDSEFWTQVVPKSDIFTFIFSSFSNLRSNLETTLDAFELAFRGNKNVKLIVKNTSDNPKLTESINGYIRRGSNIEYINRRMSFEDLRTLYSSVHCGLNVWRFSSFGLIPMEQACCNVFSILGDFCPSDQLMGSSCLKLKPTGLVEIDQLVEPLTNFGLQNCYGNFSYIQSPCIHQYSPREYANLMIDVMENWGNKYSKIDVRRNVIDNYNLKDKAKILTEVLT